MYTSQTLIMTKAYPLTALPPDVPALRVTIIKTYLTPNYFEGFFTCSPFCIYAHCREFFWLQRTLFNNSRCRPPNHKGTTYSILSGPNFTCLVTVQPWTHRPIYSNTHSATCWTQEMTFNTFLHCQKHGQLRDAYTIIGQWGQVRFNYDSYYDLTL